MILGILSDTHGKRNRTAAAIRLLRKLGATRFVHCGDVGGTGVLEELTGLDAHLVYGNTDSPDPELVACAKSLGLAVAQPPPVRLSLDGRRIVAFHGHEAEFALMLGALIEHGALPDWTPPCDYLLHGHTHERRNIRIGPVRVINPGALQRASRYSVATLDVAADRVDFWQVRDGEADAEPTRLPPP